MSEKIRLRASARTSSANYLEFSPATDFTVCLRPFESLETLKQQQQQQSGSGSGRARDDEDRYGVGGGGMRIDGSRGRISARETATSVEQSFS